MWVGGLRVGTATTTGAGSETISADAPLIKDIVWRGYIHLDLTVGCPLQKTGH